MKEKNQVIQEIDELLKPTDKLFKPKDGQNEPIKRNKLKEKSGKEQGLDFFSKGEYDKAIIKLKEYYVEKNQFIEKEFRKEAEKEYNKKIKKYEEFIKKMKQDIEVRTFNKKEEKEFHKKIYEKKNQNIKETIEKQLKNNVEFQENNVVLNFYLRIIYSKKEAINKVNNCTIKISEGLKNLAFIDQAAVCVYSRRNYVFLINHIFRRKRAEVLECQENFKEALEVYKRDERYRNTLAGKLGAKRCRRIIKESDKESDIAKSVDFDFFKELAKEKNLPSGWQCSGI